MYVLIQLHTPTIRLHVQGGMNSVVMNDRLDDSHKHHVLH
jgi:hypothetical protein